MQEVTDQALGAIRDKCIECGFVSKFDELTNEQRGKFIELYNECPNDLGKKEMKELLKFRYQNSSSVRIREFVNKGYIHKSEAKEVETRWSRDYDLQTSLDYLRMEICYFYASFHIQDTVKSLHSDRPTNINLLHRCFMYCLYSIRDREYNIDKKIDMIVKQSYYKGIKEQEDMLVKKEEQYNPLKELHPENDLDAVDISKKGGTPLKLILAVVVLLICLFLLYASQIDKNDV